MCEAHGIELPKIVKPWIDVPPHPEFSDKIVVHRRISKVSERIIFITKYEKESYYRLGGHRKGLIIYNLISNFTNKSCLKLKDEKRFKIAVIENYRWSRGTDRIVEIAQELRNKGRKDIVFIVAGDMSLLIKKNETIIDLVEKKGLSEYFQFLGHVSCPEDIILSCNALVSLTRRAGPWGRSVIEAMKMKKLIISTGPNNGFIINNKTGIYMKQYNPEFFADRIIWLIDNKESYNSISKAGYD